MTPVLDVRHLSTRFATPAGTAVAVDDVSFTLDAAETLALVGESGCGKTVTALSLLRLIEPPGVIDPSSRVMFQDTDVLQLSRSALREVRGAGMAIVFQDPSTSLNPVLKVGWQIAETLLAHEAVAKDEAWERAVQMLALVGIADPARRAQSYPHELSGGMQQRVMLAIALVCRPSVLIADEPTTALDVTVQAQILDLLGELQRELGMALLLITHDLGVAAQIADRVAVMYGGRIVESGTTRTLYREPAHPYTEGLLAAAPRIEGSDRLEAIPGSVPPATRWPSGCRFHPRCAKAWARCAEEEPDLLEVDDRHRARCWLVTDAGGAS